MAKKKKAAGPSVCEIGGPEIQVMRIRVRIADAIELESWSCGSSADFLAILLDSSGHEQPVAHQQGSTHVSAILPALPVGNHVLVWSFLQISTPWQTRVEVSVNGTDRFRQRKDSAGSRTPFLRGFLLIDVLP